jgi:hypothetical protein
MVVIIKSTEREIQLLDSTDTWQEGVDIIAEDFMETFLDNGRTQEDFDNGVGEYDEWNLNEDNAFLNGRFGINYDWKMFWL